MNKNKKFLVIQEWSGCECHKPGLIAIGDFENPGPHRYIPAAGPKEDFEVLSWAGVKPRFTDLGQILFALVIKGEEVVFKENCPVCGQEIWERFYLSQKEE